MSFRVGVTLKKSFIPTRSKKSVLKQIGDESRVSHAIRRAEAHYSLLAKLKKRLVQGLKT